MSDLRVLIADDHVPTRAGIRLALEGHGFSVCAETADAPSAVAEARRTSPDICLLDIRMPGNGLAAAAAIANELPATAVVMLTVSRDDDDLFTALRCGASGYLLKDIESGELPAALASVARGEAALPASLVARVLEEFRGRRRRLPLPGGRGRDLTDREWEILELLHTGHSTAEIADLLVIEPVTVRGHVAALMRKLRVRSRAEAIRLLDER